MIGRKQEPIVATRLNAPDYLKLEQVCRVQGKTKTEVLRAAMLEYLDRFDSAVECEQKDKLAEALLKVDQQRKKDVERLAKLMARLLIDVGLVNQVLYMKAPSEQRDQLWKAAKVSAINRLKSKRPSGDPEAAEICAQ